jgi:hypothetical protein
VNIGDILNLTALMPIWEAKHGRTFILIGASPMLTFPCPETGHRVSSSIETTEDDLVRMRCLKVSVWCPHCKLSHVIPMADTWLEHANPS